jgi:hypothetical protein
LASAQQRSSARMIKSCATLDAQRNHVEQPAPPIMAMRWRCGSWANAPTQALRGIDLAGLLDAVTVADELDMV